MRRLRALRGARPADPRMDAVRGGRRAPLRAAGIAPDRRGRDRRQRRSRPGTAGGRPLGPRQAAALAELCRGGPRRRPGRGARRTGTVTRRSPVWPDAGSSRSRSASGRGDRSPLGRRACAARDPPERRSRPAQAAAVETVDAARSRDGDPTPLAPRRRHRRWQDRDLRRGDRRRARAGPAGARAGAGDRAGRAARRPAPGGPRSPGRARPLGAVATASAPTSGGASGAGDVDIVAGTRLAVLAPLARRRRRDRRRGARGGLQERPDPAAPGPRHGDPARAARRCAPSSSAARRRPSTASAGPVTAPTGGSRSRRGRPASRRGSTSSTCGRSCVAGNRGLLSGRLAAALAALDPATGEQAILVINRRGTASVVLCRDCGHVQACPDCERPLVYHQAGTTLRCHHCGRASPLASRCPSCSSARIRYLGGGTERVEREVRERFPALRVAGSTGTSSSGAVRPNGSSTRSQAGQARRARRDEPRRQGPRRPERHPRRRRLGRRLAQPPRRARRGADLPAAGPGGRSSRAVATGLGRRSSRPTSPSTRPSSRSPRTTPRPSTTPSWTCGAGSARRRTGGW